MVLRSLILICLSFPLLSLSCSRDDSPESPAGDDTFRAVATGGLNFDVSGTTKAALVYYPSPKKTVLTLELVAPEGQWRRLVFNVWNYNREGVRDKLYLVYSPPPGSPTVTTDEAVSGSLMPDASSIGWVDFNSGQIEFEYYGTDRVRGTFIANLKTNDPRLPLKETVVLEGRFDTSYNKITK
ncbi:hypothetical protein [Salmonirosea aquatica]|uniref:Uncharacterized protein n=1 Tax=Salmonirosea aquatica TaxID=2654236 RepID=A0A7C9BA38_9BACT|nr:hypothetical protein [Cytophagaceae bacterium SJW1-29]